MKLIIDKLVKIYFSPTNSTKNVICTVAKSWGVNEQRNIDLRSLGERHNFRLNLQPEEAIILGIPVYEERIPDLLYPALSKIRGNGNPMVLIVTYGNISSGIALKQLNKMMRNQGFKIVAAASFIGEHSFSYKEIKIAAGRPDIQDLEIAKSFGNLIRDKIESIENIENLPELNIKGKISSMGKLLPRHSEITFAYSPVVDSALCKKCKKCLEVCPVNAIDPDNLKSRDKLCIRCFACVKFCPNNARKVIFKKPVLVKNTLKQLSKKRREPEIYI
ncbi:MAG: EFR1 family ferrodoxin [Atribacterota bacterium]|nr:EFR1 family ferrodoxin [Atribacterota bacterium]